MGKAEKKERRRRFRAAVFKRDGYRCVMCGFQSSPEEVEEQLDAHHITPREEFPNGGYVRANGISLCDPAKWGGDATSGCHWKAEQMLRRVPRREEEWAAFSKSELYRKIGSSLEAAVEEDQRLG